jgi:hypothetical protein
MDMMSRAAMWLRGGLYVGIALFGFLLNDQNFRETVAPWVLTAVGGVSTGFVALRAYIDKSPTEVEGDIAPVRPVEIVNSPEHPVPVEESR